jgi:outer membrane biosynthesis protein TonB
MLPQAPKPKSRNSSKVNLLISLIFHTVIVAALIYFAAREGLLGKQLKKIAVEMVKEKLPEKPKEPEKPKDEPPKAELAKIEPPKVDAAPKVDAPKTDGPKAPPTPGTAPSAVAPPAVEVPSFVFDGGKVVETSSDAVHLYKAFVEYSLRAKWKRPTDVADDNFVVEVEVSIARTGELRDPDWKRGSGNTRWDNSVRQAIAATKAVGRTPPANFPPRILVRFDLQDATEPITQ